MNDMRASQIENNQPICCARTRQELIDFLARERVEPYVDGRWGKDYRRGGPLEWKNPLEAPNYEGYCFHGLVQYFPPYLPEIEDVLPENEL